MRLHLPFAAVIDRYIESILHVALDFFAKGLFGMILVGSREVLENEHTCEALLAMALLGIRPNEHGKITRRASMSAAHMPAIEAVRGSDDAPVYVEVDISGYATHESHPDHHAPMPVPRPAPASGPVQRQQSRKAGQGGPGGALRPTQPVFSFSVDEQDSPATPMPALALPPRGVSANPAASPAGGLRHRDGGKGTAAPLTSPAAAGAHVSTSEATAAAARRASASRAAAAQAAAAAAAAAAMSPSAARDASPDRHPGMVSYDMYAVRQQREAAAAAAAAAAGGDDEEGDDDAGEYDGDVDFARPDGVRLVYGSLDEDRRPPPPSIVPPIQLATGGMSSSGGGGGGNGGGADPFVQLMMRAQGNPALMAQMMALMLQAQNNLGSPAAGSAGGGRNGSSSASSAGDTRPTVELTSPAARGSRM